MPLKRRGYDIPKRKLSYTTFPATYSEGNFAVQVHNDTGWKCTLNDLLDALHARYSHRENCYILSPSKLAKFERMVKEGWTAGWGGDFRPPEHFTEAQIRATLGHTPLVPKVKPRLW